MDIAAIHSAMLKRAEDEDLDKIDGKSTYIPTDYADAASRDPRDFVDRNAATLAGGTVSAALAAKPLFNTIRNARAAASQRGTYKGLVKMREGLTSAPPAAYNKGAVKQLNKRISGHRMNARMNSRAALKSGAATIGLAALPLLAGLILDHRRQVKTLNDLGYLNVD